MGYYCYCLCDGGSVEGVRVSVVLFSFTWVICSCLDLGECILVVVIVITA